MGYGSDLGRVGALRCPDLAQKWNHGYFPSPGALAGPL